MEADDNTYREQIVHIASLAGSKGVIDGITFTDCDIKGPAVLLLHEASLLDCGFVESQDAVLWEVPHSRPLVAGAVLVRNCTFERCLFINIGFAGPPDFIEEMKQGMKGGLSLFTPSVQESSEGEPPPTS